MHIDWWVLLAAGIAMVFLLLVWMTVALQIGRAHV